MTVLTLVVVALAVAVVVAVVVLVIASRRPSDGVDSFRRQIDALSPEARRGVVDQVHSAGRDDADVPPPGAPGPTEEEGGRDDA